MFDQYWTSETHIDPEIAEHYEKIAERLRNGESVDLSDAFRIKGGGNWFIGRLCREFPDAKVEFKK